MAIALWYCPYPGSGTYETLEILISSLQTVFPNSPIFEPHITITSNLLVNSQDDVNKILTSCVAAIQSIKPKYLESLRNDPINNQLITFDKCCIGKQFFNKIILQCTESSYLYGIARIMRELFVEMEDNGKRASDWLQNEFRPHLSLLYSETSPISKAHTRIIQQRIEDALDVQMVHDSSTPIIPSESHSIQEKWRFQGSPLISWGLPGTFKIVNCVGPVDKWQVLGRADV